MRTVPSEIQSSIWRNVNCSQGCRHNESQWLTDGFEGNLTGLHAQCDLMLHKLSHKTDYYLMLLMSSTLLSKQAALCWESLKSSRLRKLRVVPARRISAGFTRVVWAVCRSSHFLARWWGFRNELVHACERRHLSACMLERGNFRQWRGDFYPHFANFPHSWD